MRTLPLLAFAIACTGPVGDGDGTVDDDEIPQVGWRAELVEHHHDVTGTAELIDEDTIEITGFGYDGQGLNARFFLLADGEDFHDTYELTDNLVRNDAYVDETLTLDVPAAAEPGTWNFITLWCVPAAVSFGDGKFEAP